MSKEQLVLRLLSSVANIDSQRLRTGFLEEMDFTRLAPAMNALAEAPIYIDDTPNISTMELRTKARRLQAESGLDLIIVDYLQLMQSSVQSRDANRVQEVSEISRGLKALARELQVPGRRALAALAPDGAARDGEPRLSDLRESGAIEQDSDLVMFLWREKERRGRAGARRRDHQPAPGQAPQRPHRRDQALVPEAPDALRLVRGRGPLRGERLRLGLTASLRRPAPWPSGLPTLMEPRSGGREERHGRHHHPRDGRQQPRVVERGSAPRRSTRASNTVRNIRHIEVVRHTARVDQGRIVEYQVRAEDPLRVRRRVVSYPQHDVSDAVSARPTMAPCPSDR